MWVRLTKEGYDLVCGLVVLDGPMASELYYSTIRHPKSIDVEAPYAVWKYVQGLLNNQIFGPRGGKKTEKGFTAMRRITRELNYVEFHPALSGTAMFGWHGDRFPVWQQDADDRGRIWTPYPTPGHDFRILEPVWEHPEGEQKLTRWLPKTSGPGRLCLEETHLRLQRTDVVR